MKKKLSLGLALLMSLNLAACGGNSEKEEGSTETIVQNSAFKETIKEMQEEYSGDDKGDEISSILTIYEDYVKDNYGTRIGEFSDNIEQRVGYHDEYNLWTYRFDDVEKKDEDLNVGVIKFKDTTMCKGQENETRYLDATVSTMDEDQVVQMYEFKKTSYSNSGDSMDVSNYTIKDWPLFGPAGDMRMADDVYSVVLMFGAPDKCAVEFTDDCIKVTTMTVQDYEDAYVGKYTSTTTVESELYADHMSSTINVDRDYESGEVGKEVIKSNVQFKESKTLDEINEMCKDIIDVAKPYEGDQNSAGTKVDTGWSDIEAKFKELFK